MKDFYFVRRAGSGIQIQLDGRSHQGDAIPLVLDGTRMHFVRYSTRPLIATWNPAPGAHAVVLAHGDALAPQETAEVEARGVRYTLDANGPFYEIRCMSRPGDGQEVTVEFSPPVPHLLALADDTDAVGAFRITRAIERGERYQAGAPDSGAIGVARRAGRPFRQEPAAGLSECGSLRRRWSTRRGRRRGVSSSQQVSQSRFERPMPEPVASPLEHAWVHLRAAHEGVGQFAIRSAQHG